MAAFPVPPLVIPPLAPLAAALVAGGAELWRRPRLLRREVERLRGENRRLRAAAERAPARPAGDAAGRALADTAHELRTPLNGILGMAELLAGTGLDPEQDSYVAAIRSAGTALASLVDGLLDLARIEAGKNEDDFGDAVSEPFDPVRLVEGVVELLAPAAQAKGLEIAAHVGPGVPARVAGDAVKLRQVLLNLAGNAVKFTGTGGVGVRVALVGDGVAGDDVAGTGLAFAVEDTGPGVPADRRAAIFEDFEREAPGGAGPAGTGLGLAISHRLATRMGGTLAVGEGGTGACFTLTVPLPAGGEAAYQQHAPVLAGRRVLVASASPFGAPYLARQLAEAGATVTRLADPQAARHALLTQAPFDAVLVDCALGDAALAALAAAARLAGAGRTAVMFSPGERRTFGPAAGRGFNGWLVKPVRRQTLLALIGSRLVGSRLVDPNSVDPNSVDPTRAGAQAVQPVAGASPPGRLAVLLAEDDEVSALLAMRHLARLGATVAHAADGLAAVALAESAMAEGRPFSAAVLDLRMPGLDGLEVARRLRLAEAERGLPPCRITILSGDTEGMDRAGTGVDAVVAKPVTFARLADALLPALGEVAA